MPVENAMLPESEETKVLAVAVTNGSYRGRLFRAGDKVRIPKDVAEELLRAGAVRKPKKSERDAAEADTGEEGGGAE